MKTLYEHLIKQHIKNSDNKEFQLYSMRLSGKRLWVIVDNINDVDMLYEISGMPKHESSHNIFIKYLNKGLKVAFTIELDRLMYDIVSGNDMKDTYTATNKKISIHNFTWEYWRKHGYDKFN